MPAATIISAADLNAFLAEVVAKCYAYDAIDGLCIELLYMTGCRFQDTTYFHQWQYLPGPETITYIAQKTNTPRVFPAARLSPTFLSLLQAGAPLFDETSYKHVLATYGRAASGKALYSQQKGLHLHVFRHNYARRLLAQGLTPNQIKLDMGIHYTSTINGYLYLPIHQYRAPKPL